MDYFRNMIGYPKAPGECINILLLGETGVGKSTFINSFVNYCSYRDFDNALTKKPLWVIPTKFSLFDFNLKEHVISIGTKKKDKNEYLEQGRSSTQGTKSYLFPMNNFNLRIIDTPGMGDQDKKNVDNILDYLGSYEKLHAIMILLKPNQNKLTVWFEYCIQQLLPQLDKTAANNLVFVFTYSRILYKPGESAVLMREFIKKLKSNPPHVDIPFSMKNIFCLVNEAYRFFLAYKNGIEFSDGEICAYAGCWDQSVNETARLLKYVLGENSKSPHLVQNTPSINDAISIINMLLKPLADITNLINDNKRILKERAEVLKKCKEANVELSAKLYVPCVKIKLVELDAPTTVCASDKCVTSIPMEGVLSQEYNKRCHDPCHLKNVPKEIIGSPELCDCAAMKRGICQFCGCPFTTHMHIYYMSERYNDKAKDTVVEEQLRNIKRYAERYEVLLEIMKQKDQELDREHKTIITYSAKFAHFITYHSILPINDAYETYFTYLKNMEKEKRNANFVLIKRYEECLRMYNEEKSILDRAQRAGDSNYHEICPKEIFVFVEGLFKLKHMGETIKMLYQEQKKKITAERHQNEGYICEIFYTIQSEMAEMNNSRNNLQCNGESVDQREDNSWDFINQCSSEPSVANTSNQNTIEPQNNYGDEMVEEIAGETFEIRSDDGKASENSVEIQEDYISFPIEFYNRIDTKKLNEVKENSGLKKIKFAKMTSCEMTILNLISTFAKSLDTTNNSKNHKAIVSVPYEVGAKLVGNDGYLIKNIVIALKLQEIQVLEQKDTNTEVDFILMGKKDNVNKAEEILKNHDLYGLLVFFRLLKVPSKIDHNSFTHFCKEMYFNIYLQGGVEAIKRAKDSFIRNFYFVENIYVSENHLNIVLGRNDSNLKAASEIPNVYKIVRDNNTLQIIAYKEEALVEAKKMLLVEKLTFKLSKEAYADLLAKKEFILDQFNCVLDKVTTTPDSLVLVISGPQNSLATVKAIIDRLIKNNS